MAFAIIYFNLISIFLNKSVLHLAIEDENIEVIKYLFANNKLDINLPCVFLYL